MKLCAIVNLNYLPIIISFIGQFFNFISHFLHFVMKPSHLKLEKIQFQNKTKFAYNYDRNFKKSESNLLFDSMWVSSFCQIFIWSVLINNKKIPSVQNFFEKERKNVGYKKVILILCLWKIWGFTINCKWHLSILLLSNCHIILYVRQNWVSFFTKWNR